MRVFTLCLLFAAFAASAQSDKPQSLPPTSNPEIFTDALAGTFVLVQGGSFDMGGTKSEEEKPIHRVTLSDYYIGETEVTQAQWRAVMGNNPSDFEGCDLCPVENVSWIDIQVFLQKINSKGGSSIYRLPTEAEWEYAARGGAQSKGYTYAGSNNIDDVAWFESNSGGRTQLVKHKSPNELGLYDMSGNVWEWCSDWYERYPSVEQTNPTGPETGSDRVFRGGSWFFFPENSRVAVRGRYAPNYRSRLVGFRLARAVTN